MAWCLLAGHATPALADEPRKVTEPYVLAEPAEFTQVVDAADEGDPFDLHISLGYQQTWRSSKIRRETSIGLEGFSTGGYLNDEMNVAAYSQSVSRLNTRVDIGIYHDIALVLRMPVILGDERKLEGLDGSDRVQSSVLAGSPGEQLFRLPFTSPARSGIEYFAVGLDFGIFNQFRDPTKPTWVIGVEGRFNVSEPMHACNEDPVPNNISSAQLRCAHPGDMDRDGVSGEFFDQGLDLEGNFNGGVQPGVSRGTTGLEAHTMLSRRVKYVEPYGGFRALFEFPTDDSDYGLSDFKGALVNHPPLRGTMIMGMAVYPWEVRDQYQRLGLDFRFTGTYVSEGRDYSELFDALGSSDAWSMRYPQYSDYQGDPTDDTVSVVNPRSSRVFFTGLTDVQAHGEYTFSAALTWQAGEYVKFNLGGAYTLAQPHIITFDQPCNPDVDKKVAEAGPCRSTSDSAGGGRTVTATGIPNPNYRAVVNAPGRRFKSDDGNATDLWINATVMF